VSNGIDHATLYRSTRYSTSYQVRFGLLQAAHYGTPQSRVRFFVIAAKHGHPLPNLPQPTHDFTLADSLKISLSNGCTIEPIRTMAGTAPHHFVTVDDAIGDLPRFNWRVRLDDSVTITDLLVQEESGERTRTRQ
jgi:site-specific DNA-cytosine methylase